MSDLVSTDPQSYIMAAANSTLINNGPSTIKYEGLAAVSKAKEKQAKHQLQLERINQKRELEVRVKDDFK